MLIICTTAVAIYIPGAPVLYCILNFSALDEIEDY